MASRRKPGRRHGRVPGSHEVMRGLLRAAHHLSPGSKGGSHTEVFALDAERLSGVIQEWIADTGGDPAARSAAAVRFARQISERFILKVGNIDFFVMRFGSEEEAVLPRSYVTEAFGPIGYNLHPSFDKTVQDATEASRELPYFAAGGSDDQFAPFLPDAIRRFVAGRIDDLPTGGEDGLFLVYDVDARRELSVFDILTQDPYFKKSVEDLSALKELQRALREHPLDRATVERLQSFFNAPITVGLRDTLRWLRGSRHPTVSWDEAREIIEDCFARHGNENYLLPETNLYAPSARLAPEDLTRINANNRRVSEALAAKLTSDLPLGITRKIGSELLLRVAEQVLRFHHDYPVYHVEPTTAWISGSTLAFVGRFFTQLTTHLVRLKLPTRRNIDVEASLYRRGLLEELSEVLTAEEAAAVIAQIRAHLVQYMAVGGIETAPGTREQYAQIPTTFYSFQQLADWLPERHTVLHRVSLEQLVSTEKRFLLRAFPEIAEKLTVFFVMVLRFFLDTDFVPDLRPDESGVDLFVFGIWGAVTENVIVLVTEDEQHKTHVTIRFVDNKDHFKAYRREVDREKPLGLAKYALRLIGPVIEPAMFRAVGDFVQIVHDNRMGFKQPRPDLADHIDRVLEVSTEVVRRSMDETQAHLKAVVDDGLDDTTMLVSRVVRSVLRKPGEREKPPARAPEFEDEG